MPRLPYISEIFESILKMRDDIGDPYMFLTHLTNSTDTKILIKLSERVLDKLGYLACAESALASYQRLIWLHTKLITQTRLYSTTSSPDEILASFKENLDFLRAEIWPLLEDDPNQWLITALDRLACRESRLDLFWKNAPSLEKYKLPENLNRSTYGNIRELADWLGIEYGHLKRNFSGNEWGLPLYVYRCKGNESCHGVWQVLALIELHLIKYSYHDNDLIFLISQSCGNDL